MYLNQQRKTSNQQAKHSTAGASHIHIHIVVYIALLTEECTCTYPMIRSSRPRDPANTLTPPPYSIYYTHHLFVGREPNSYPSGLSTHFEVSLGARHVVGEHILAGAPITY